MQADAVQKGQTVIVVDDLIATGAPPVYPYISFRAMHSVPLTHLSVYFTLSGGSAKAAGELIKQQGASVLEYLFIIELTALKGSSHLDAPTYSIIQSDD